jgi:Holliday junction resolvase
VKKTRNPIAKNVGINKPKVIPDKKKKVNGRAKGKQGELEFVNFLKERGIDARRGQQYAGGTDSPDVIASGVLSSVHIEVKRKESGNIYHWLKQAATDAELFKMPVVAHRKNGERWVAIMDFRDLLTLLERAENNRLLTLEKL